MVLTERVTPRHATPLRTTSPSLISFPLQHTPNITNRKHQVLYLNLSSHSGVSFLLLHTGLPRRLSVGSMFRSSLFCFETQGCSAGCALTIIFFKNAKMCVLQKCVLLAKITSGTRQSRTDMLGIFLNNIHGHVSNLIYWTH